MKLSRYTFLTGILGGAALALAGCGGGHDDEPNTTDLSQLPIIYPGYTRSTVVSPDGTIEATTHAKPGETARYITYRVLSEGYERELYRAEENYAGEVLGRDVRLLWGPSNKLYYMTSIRHSDQDWWHTNIVVGFFKASDTSNGQLLPGMIYLQDNRLRSMERQLDPHVTIYPTGLSDDGNEFFYTREVDTDGKIVATNYAFDIAAGRATELSTGEVPA